MFSIGSAAVAWSSKKQPTVALSSTEAEYRAATVATCEAIWLRRLLRDLRIEVPTPIPIYCDNMSSMQLAKNPVFHARTKHIEVHYHFVRERVQSGEVELRYVHTDRQVADIFTKPLGSDKLQHFTDMLGVQHLDVPHLRGRSRQGKVSTETGKGKKNAEPIGRRRTGRRGDKKKEEAESTKEVGTSGCKAEACILCTSHPDAKCILCRGHHGGGDLDTESMAEFDFEEPAIRAKGRTVKTKIRTWSDVVKGLKPRVESEGTDSDKSWNESETADSDQQTDPDETDQLKAKMTRTQRKSMPSRRNQRIGKRRGHSSEGAKMGLLSRHTDQEGRSAQNQRSHGKRDRTGRGARARRSDARRSRLKEPTATEVDTTTPPQVELEGEC